MEPDPILRIQTCYEIALSIGDSLDLGEMLRHALSAYLRKLNCSAGVVLRLWGEAEGEVSLSRVYSIPRETVLGSRLPDDVELLCLRRDPRRLEALMQAIPLTSRTPAGTTYVMDLPGFGLLALVKRGEPLAVSVLESLRPLNLKLARSCMACLQRERSERESAERRRVERSLSAEKERLSTTLAGIADAVVTMDSMKRVVFMNRAAETLTGWGSQEAVGVHIRSVCYLTDAMTGGYYGGLVTKALGTGSTMHVDRDALLVDRAGGNHLVRASVSPLFDDERKTTGAVFVIHDVTEERQLQQEAQRTERLESLGVLAAGLAHDFNNLLTGVMGNIEMIRVADSSAEREACLEASFDAAKRAVGLTKQLLTFAKGGSPVKTQLLLNKIVEETVAFSLTGSNCRAEFLLESRWPVEADPAQISQVIQNLVLNAKEAMSEGGVIRVAVEDIWSPESRRFVRTSIQDSGPGVPATLQGRIFDPYFTTKESGNGLGLAVVHSVVEKHGGRVTVQSADGPGSIFAVYLPASIGVSAVPWDQAPRLPDQEPPHRQIRVLVVDDEDTVRDVLERMLRRLGHRTASCSDGAGAVRVYREGLMAGDGFDLVITDLTMPGGIGGEATAREIMALDPRAQVVVSSGYSSNAIMADWRSHQLAGVLPKPYSLADLRAVLRPFVALKGGGDVPPAAGLT
jgi:PAS domain S-box-containing protein